MSFSRIKEKSFSILTHPLSLLFLIVFNLIWGVLGALAYWPHIGNISFIIWLFIPDCPLYSILFASFLINSEKIKEYQIFIWILACCLIKYALAAPFFFFMYPARYAPMPIFGIQLPNIYPFDYFHLFLLFQGLFVILFLNKSVKNFSITLGWIIINDIIDFLFITSQVYDIAVDKIVYFLIYAISLDLAILIIGLFFVLNIPTHLKNYLDRKKYPISSINMLGTFFIEDK